MPGCRSPIWCASSCGKQWPAEGRPTADEIRIRPIAPDELGSWSDGEWKAWGYRQGESWQRVLASCDLLTAVDENVLVGGTASTPFSLTVPGGVLPVAGVASVWVSPDRRGRGVLRRLMDAQLAGFAEDGFAAAVLVASEPGVYRRFGFGAASFSATVRVASGRSRGRSEVDPGTLTLAERDAGVAVAAEVYDRVRTGVPGMLDRSTAWWEYSFPEADAGEEHPTLFLLHAADDGACDGYAAYSVRAGWTGDGRPANTALVQELVAESPRAYAALWESFLELALCRRVEAENRPVDEPLLHMLEDPARISMSIVDALHLRLFDVPTALASRRYSAEGELGLAVHDDAGGWADGHWLLVAGRDGAECARTDRAPDVALDASALGCVYLGGTTFDQLRRAGRVEELAQGAVRRADELFSWSPAPWLPWDY